MRAITLTIYVSFLGGFGLAGSAFADAPEFTNGPAQTWASVHEQGLAAHSRRSYSEAAEFFRQSWPLADSPLEKAVTGNDLGQTYRRLGRTAEAQEWIQRSYDVWKQVPNAGPNLALSAASLADVWRDEGRYDRAEAILREALRVPLRHPQASVVVRNSLADLLREEGRSEEARELFLASLKEKDEVTWQEYANALSGLADIDRQSGDWEGSAEMWNQTIRLAQEKKDEVSEAVATRGLAAMWLEAGQAARAEPLFRRALGLVEGNPAAPKAQVAAALSGTGALYRVQNKFSLAEDAYRRALEIERADVGEAHPQTAWLMELLSDVYAETGDREMALDYATRAVNVMKSLFGDHALPFAAAMANRAAVEQREKELSAAVQDYETALTIARSYPGNEVFKQTMVKRYAQLLKSMHRDHEAKTLMALTRSFR